MIRVRQAAVEFSGCARITIVRSCIALWAYRERAEMRPSGLDAQAPAAVLPLPASSASSSASRLARAFSTMRQEMIEAS